MRESQIRSDQYVALQQKISGAKQEIAFQERLLEKRLSSTYHSQWNQGEATVAKIASLKNKLAELTESSSGVGLEMAEQQVPTTRLFNEISQVLNISSKLITAVGYGLLSLLLEVSTLGMISLANTFKLDTAVNQPRFENAENGLDVADSERQDVEAQQMKARLTDDIIKGNTPPVLRKILAADYGLGIDVIRQVLRGLYAAGILEADKRNSYKLAGPLQNTYKRPSGSE